MNATSTPAVPPPIKARAKRAKAPVPPLIDGQALSAAEFMRRYEAMPDLKKAELIDGIVYIMSSPLRAENHGDPDSLMQFCLGFYSFHTPGVRVSSNATTILGPSDIPQPDVSMRYLPVRTGQGQFDKKGYLNRRPELVVEIAASSVWLDLGKKRDAYLRAGIPEYIAWCTEVKSFHWLFFENGEYKPLPPGEDGILRSRVFPGLWIDPNAILEDNRERVLEVLQMGLKSKEHAEFAVLK